MGRNAKTRKDRKLPKISLAGEQAEVFCDQMDGDRAWFQSCDATHYFRPEIDGEFNDYLVVGSDAPFVHAVVQTSAGIGELPLGWVCVTDIGRYLNDGGPASTSRFRVRTSPPFQADVRQQLIVGVNYYVEDFIRHVIQPDPKYGAVTEHDGRFHYSVHRDDMKEQEAATDG